jgi:hypothetical protein
MSVRRYREVVVGSNSTLWRTLSARSDIAHRSFVAMGHAELSRFDFASTDRVWVFSYSRQAEENAAMIALLRAANVAEIVYVSSSSTIVTQITGCYRYPTVKRQAEEAVSVAPQGKVLMLGLVYSALDDLPSGDNVATSYDELAQFMCSPCWPDGEGRRRHLLRVVERPFESVHELRLYRLYGRMLSWLVPRPCLLRPLDLVLRAMRMRWYGYVYLSNRLWISTIS